MKMRIERVRVTQFKSGPREGQWRPFDLPEGAVILRTHTYGLEPGGSRRFIEYAVPDR